MQAKVFLYNTVSYNAHTLSVILTSAVFSGHFAKNLGCACDSHSRLFPDLNIILVQDKVLYVFFGQSTPIS